MKALLATIALALGLAGTAIGAVPVSAASPTAGVATLELVHLLLVFERDVLDERDADAATRDRLYAMGGLVTVGVDDSLILVKLPAPSRL